MSGVSGLLFYQLNFVENEKNGLENELVDVNKLLSEKQNQSIQLQNQVTKLQNQTKELQEIIEKHTNVVNITEFTVTDFGPYVGLTTCSTARLTIQNYGINDVTNLVLTLENANTAKLDKTITFDIIHSGETIHINQNVFWTLGLSESFNATLLNDEKIFDTCTTAFSYD